MCASTANASLSATRRTSSRPGSCARPRRGPSGRTVPAARGTRRRSRRACSDPSTRSKSPVASSRRVASACQCGSPISSPLRIRRSGNRSRHRSTEARYPSRSRGGGASRPSASRGPGAGGRARSGRSRRSVTVVVDVLGERNRGQSDLQGAGAGRVPWSRSCASHDHSARARGHRSAGPPFSALPSIVPPRSASVLDDLHARRAPPGTSRRRQTCVRRPPPFGQFGAARAVQSVAAKASATTSNASCSRASVVASGGRKRNTLPQVPQVSVTTPLRWQCALTAAARAASGAPVLRMDQLDRHHRAAAADVARSPRACRPGRRAGRA